MRWEGVKCVLSFDGRISVYLFRLVVNIICVRGAYRIRYVFIAGRVCVIVGIDSIRNLGIRRGGVCRVMAGI